MLPPLPLWERDGVRGASDGCSPRDLLFNPLPHAVHVLHDLVVPKADYLKSLRLQPHGSSLTISCGRRVLSAIEFDHQLQLEADEIDNISADWRLPPELGAADLPIAQPIPK